MDYAALKTAIASRADRSDLTALIPDFIAGAETRIAFGDMANGIACDPLRIRAMEQSSYADFSAQNIQLPTGFLQMRRLYLSSDPKTPLKNIPAFQFWERHTASASGKPLEFTLEGDELILGPAPDGTYTGRMLYYKQFTALSVDADTNWLLTNAPAAYIQGALIDLWDHMMDEERRNRAYANFCGAINALNSSDKSDRFSGSPWVAYSDTGNP